MPFFLQSFVLILLNMLHPQHRRHFTAVACEGCIYAVGGWYLDSLVTPDSSTALYTAVERYDPWEDTWRFVSSLTVMAGLWKDTENNMWYVFPLHTILPLFVDQLVTEFDLCLRFVSSLPLIDFHFTMSLSYDVPLATSLGESLYVLGSIQRTGEKLLLQYNTRHGKAEHVCKRNRFFLTINLVCTVLIIFWHQQNKWCLCILFVF